MKLIRARLDQRTVPGIVDNEGSVRNLSSHVEDINGDALSPNALKEISKLNLEELPSMGERARLEPCVGSVGKFICIGLNYADHAREAGLDVPADPIVFMKATTCLAGANDTVVLPPKSEKSDWEVELGVVIGTTARRVMEKNALDHVAGYCVVNDVSERSYQFDHGGQWVKGKSLDTFGPIGPWLVTTDEVLDPQNLGLWLDVNGERMQTGNTKTMIFTVAQIVSHLSHYMTLEPGDLIATGTPPGVGMGQKPPKFLKDGDEIRLGIDGMGEQSLRVRGFENS